MRWYVNYLLPLLLTMAMAAGAPAQIAPSGLSLAAPQPLFPRTIQATGRLQALTSARIAPRVTGRLVAFGTTPDGQALDVGMWVKAGQVLFNLDDTTFRNTVGMAEAQVQSARAALADLTAPTRPERITQLRQAVAELDARVADRQKEETRYRRLVEVEKTLPLRRLEEVQVDLATFQAQRSAAEARLRESEAGPTKTAVAVAQARVHEAEAALKVAQHDLDDTAVRAPFDGLITRRFKSPGDYLTSGPPTDVLELVAADKLEAQLDLPESYLAQVKAGSTQVSIRSPLLKGALSVPITRIVPNVDPARGTFAVRVAIPADRAGSLAPGAFVNADLALDVSPQATPMIVPTGAIVQERDGRARLYVATGHTMSARDVEVGDHLTEGIVVKSGLSADEQVVVGPAAAMTDGAALPEDLVQAH